MRDPLFNKYAAIYQAHGYLLYMVGGTSRDYLLGIPYADYDFVTDATPAEEKAFLPQAQYRFAKFGSIKVMEGSNEIDITTFRKEGAYLDHRHPDSITFIKDPKEDYLRRDFTINALYITPEDEVLDYCGGQKDLKAGLIRFIGDPETRIEEDPLRILRAERFAKRLGFSIEPKSKAAIEKLRPLLSTLNPEKVKMELLKEPK
ncbi:MAG: CCA-adding enzyme [Tenericutes bacterium ADurb.BinA155]|jgi:tRNA nucleotidyltransferase (CCA-adding enzyme)|nr:MAG: CCA-adding enzyme [Tenericutes bacterium ADurb.BinA155]